MHSTLLPSEAAPRLRALCAMHAALQPRHRKVLHANSNLNPNPYPSPYPSP